MADTTPTNTVIVSDDSYVTTFYLRPGRKPIQHVYGPYPRAKALRERRNLLADPNLDPRAVYHVAVCRAIKLSDEP